MDKREIRFILVFLLILAVLVLLPTGFERQIYLNAEGVKATVLSVDNTGLYSTGLIKQGAQRCVLRIENGVHKGEDVTGTNLFSGKLEFDKVFEPGDTAWVLLEHDPDGHIIYANMIEHYRMGSIALLIGLFALCIILFSGYTGLRTLLSFSFALLAIWKILIPCMLKGISPIWVALVVGNVITVTTLLLVAGFTKKAYTAIAGAVFCSFITCFMAILWGHIFKIHGAVMQWSESCCMPGSRPLI